MIEERDIVCMSPMTWDDHWGTPQQLMSRLAPSNRVFFVDQPISPLSLLTGVRKRNAVWRQFRRWLSGPRKVADNVWAGAPPPILPMRTRKTVHTINAWILRWWLSRQVRRLGMRDVVFWNFQPAMPGVASAVKPAVKMFHLIDDFSGTPYWWENAKHLLAREGESAREADVVVCTGRKLVESRRKYNSNIHFVPEGADVASFGRAADPELAVPEGIASLPGKVVGYVGVIDFRLDVPLMERMAREHPDWSIALVGPVKGDTQDMTALRAMANVHFYGRQDLSDVPSFVKGMDVCLLPYILNDFTHHIFPLKLYEYLAAGKPIISSAMDEMVPFDGRELVVARSHDEFIAAVARAIELETPELAAERREMARNQSWDDRVEQISDILEPWLESGGQAGAPGSSLQAEPVAGG